MCSVTSSFLQPQGLQPTTLLCPWDFPGRSAGVGYHFLLRGISPTQRSRLHLLCWQVDSLPVSHLGSPAILQYTIKIKLKINKFLPTTMKRTYSLGSFSKNHRRWFFCLGTWESSKGTFKSQSGTIQRSVGQRR